jgi:hypothetical protein
VTRIGSLCSGYEGIGLGLELALGVNLDTDLAWHAEYEAAPSAVLAHHWPQVPNLHDIKLIDWDDIEPVDWLTAGYPCQPFSTAGQRKGDQDVEWMMGLPAGHVTDVPTLTRNEMLKMLGNGVVPQQAAEAVRWLLSRQGVAA